MKFNKILNLCLGLLILSTVGSTSYSQIVAWDHHFIVDSQISNVMVEATIMGQTDQDNSAVVGWIDVDLPAGNGPISMIHVNDLAIDLAEQIELNYRWVFLTGQVSSTDLGIDMAQAGSIGLVNEIGQFTQVENIFTGRGSMAYDMPFASGQVALAEMDPITSDFAGVITQQDTVLKLEMSIDLEFPLILDGSDIGTARITGTIIAYADIYWTRADFNSDNSIDISDLEIFLSHWLTSGQDIIADIAPLEPDGVVNLLDMQVFANSWLSGYDVSQ
ncbi:MAG: hypothetical protein JEZ07_16925 [Phycisphaerae bacterium]|nr:hypothetical protein [Phycisphaerae bacterium]